MSGRDVLANRVAFVAIKAAPTLLEVDGVSGKVPMDDRVAPPVRVDPFLANRDGRENGWPEWRIECRPHHRESDFFLALTRAAESQRIPAREAEAIPSK